MIKTSMINNNTLTMQYHNVNHQAFIINTPIATCQPHPFKITIKSTISLQISKANITLLKNKICIQLSYTDQGNGGHPVYISLSKSKTGKKLNADQKNALTQRLYISGNTFAISRHSGDTAIV